MPPAIDPDPWTDTVTPPGKDRSISATTSEASMVKSMPPPPVYRTTVGVANPTSVCIPVTAPVESREYATSVATPATVEVVDT